MTKFGGLKENQRGKRETKFCKLIWEGKLKCNVNQVDINIDQLYHFKTIFLFNLLTSAMADMSLKTQKNKK